MSENFEVPTPILNGPFDPPRAYWKIEPDRRPTQMQGQREASSAKPPNAGCQPSTPTGVSADGAIGSSKKSEKSLPGSLPSRQVS